MTTIGDRYPELTTLHQEFMRALAADKKPQSDHAYLWYQGIDFDRNKRKPSATTRGTDSLYYLKVDGELRQKGSAVPDQKFAKAKTPKEVCSGLISRHADDWDGPYQINFRYERNSKGIWSGFYSIETSAQHRDTVVGRKEYDAAIAAALGATWEKGTKVRQLMKVQGKRPGILLVVENESGTTYSEPDPALKEAWDNVVGYLKSKGMRELYAVNYELTKPTSRLVEDDTVKLIYSV
jgi:hypothetical protein